MVTDVSQGAAARNGTVLGGGKALGKEDFLQLLVAQLQNQDPLNPSDPTEFTSQLAQFSSLEQLANVNQTLEKMTSSQDLMAMSFIGREVVAESSRFQLGSSAAGAEFGYRLETPADEVTLFIRDSLGRTVATLEPPETGTGEHFLQWDGRDGNGQPLPAGDYELLVSALRGEDEAVPATALIKVQVTGVDLSRAGALLVTAGGTIPVDRVTMVRGG